MRYLNNRLGRAVKLPIKLCIRLITETLISIKLFFLSAGYSIARGSQSKAPKVFLRTVLAPERDFDLIPHFFNYYIQLGIRDFLVILHSEDIDSKVLEKGKELVRSLTKGLHVKIELWVGESFTDGEKVVRLDRLIQGLDGSEWIMSVDNDEFQEYPGGLKKILWECNRHGYDYVKGILWDRISADQMLHPLRCDKPLWVQCSKKLRLLQDIQCNDKIALHKRSILLGVGNHELALYKTGRAESETKSHPRVIDISHYKWFSNVIWKINTTRSFQYWEMAKRRKLEVIRKTFLNWRDFKDQFADE